jgi:aspartate-semialdehyde dehydrogenase
VGHAESVCLETEYPVDLNTLAELFAETKGMSYVPNLDPSASMSGSDEDEMAGFPTPRECQGQNDVFVGRLRTAKVFANGVSLWLVSDNLRKGAALNALQVVESCWNQRLFK